jgi:hypothetical protein
VTVGNLSAASASYAGVIPDAKGHTERRVLVVDHEGQPEDKRTATPDTASVDDIAPNPLASTAYIAHLCRNRGSVSGKWAHGQERDSLGRRLSSTVSRRRPLQAHMALHAVLAHRPAARRTGPEASLLAPFEGSLVPQRPMWTARLHQTSPHAAPLGCVRAGLKRN